MRERIKLGLALSGGGFRAALFHLGVLARMAELDLLRHVEVISTVSGGSVIGALYYLHLKQLLESKADEEITHRDYCDLIARMEREFLSGVQKNIRMLTFINPLKIIRMSLPNYSRSDRIGELYDEVFFRPALGKRKRPVEMRELVIRPKSTGGRRDNRFRQNKVPIILINATTLNTGHNWRFTPYSMGEPAPKSRTAREVDKNSRLSMPSGYNDITPRQQDIGLGHAVAASTGVPGLFPPLSVSGLYPRFRVQLVDGGVHDNQGIQGLLDLECTHFIVSDASGQMRDDPEPNTQVVSVLKRVIEVYSDRVREEQLLRLLEADNSRTAFIHLLKGLESQAVPWIDRDGYPAVEAVEKRTDGHPAETPGVKPSVHRLIARIRTDLDTFNDLEAFALMQSGYLISGHELLHSPGFYSLIKDYPNSFPWRFQTVRPWMEKPSPEFTRQLEAAESRFFKVFRLSPPAAAAFFTLLGAGLIAGAAAWEEEIDGLLSRSLTVGELALALSLLAVGFLPRLSRAVKAVGFLRSPADFLFRSVSHTLIPLVLCPLTWIELQVFDPIYLRLGKVERLEV